MAKNNITIGIDIGTHTTRLVAVEHNKETNNFEIIATGQTPTSGMRLGYITNTDQVAETIKSCVAQAEKTIGTKIKQAYVSIGGISLSSSIAIGAVIISKADQEVTKLDITKAITDSEENLDLTNKKIIDIIPLGYKLDGKEVHGRPEGMYGARLEVRTLFVTCLKQNIEDLVTAFALAKINILDIVPSPIATANAILSKTQKTAGCALVNIGSETVSIAVFENNLLLSMQISSVGSMDITKDIAIGLRITLEEAESIKQGGLAGDFPKKKVDEIIEARLGDILELVNNHLRRIRRSELLPAGIIFIGGGSHINRIEELSKSFLKLPSRVGPSDKSLSSKFKMRDNTWYTALGLALINNEGSESNTINTSLGDNFKQVKGLFKSLFSQLLP